MGFYAHKSTLWSNLSSFSTLCQSQGAAVGAEEEGSPVLCCKNSTRTLGRHRSADNLAITYLLPTLSPTLVLISQSYTSSNVLTFCTNKIKHRATEKENVGASCKSSYERINDHIGKATVLWYCSPTRFKLTSATSRRSPDLSVPN